MMAAIRAGQLGCTVTLLEKNPILGKKLLLSGKGRCNLTNACGLDSFLQRFSGNGQFLRDAFKKFFNRDLIKFFEERGLKLRIERQERVFPQTDRASSILEALCKELQKVKVEVKVKAEVIKIVADGKKARGVILDNSGFIEADRVILAGGGVTYPFTGSTGELLDICAKLGHSIVSLRPGLVPLEVKQKYVKALEGLTLKNIRVTFCSGKDKIISEIGELLFTATGISGPLVLTLSGRVADWLKQEKEACAQIDLKPALKPEQLEMRLLREFRSNARRSLRNTLKSLLPLRLIERCIELLGLAADKKANQVTYEERRKIAAWLKCWQLDISAARPIGEGMVTRGGVSLREVDPRTMESRLIKGLYICGEMLDIDADTGGFNLQAAFSTGYLAGESAVLS